MKLRYFYKINHKKEPIPGSNIRRKSRPKPYSQWKEITLVCCDPAEIDCTCGPRFWVQIDGANKPVDGTLIKRDAYPLMAENIRYQEIDWKSTCCTGTISWSYQRFTAGSLLVSVNGIPVVNTTMTGTGNINANRGDTIEVTLSSALDIEENNVQLTLGGFINNFLSNIFYENVYPAVAPLTFSFVWDGKDIYIIGTSS